MRTAIVSSAQIAAEPGQPLDARYWTTRLSGESYRRWKLRGQIGRRVARMRRDGEALAELLRRYEEE